MAAYGRKTRMTELERLKWSDTLTSTTLDKGTWQDYVIALTTSGYISHAAIFGTQVIQRWGASDGFHVTPPEVEEVVKGFARPDKLASQPISLAQKNYSLVKAEGDVMQARCSGGGCVLVKTNKLLIIAVYAELTYGASANNLVIKLADFLRQQHF